MSEPDTGKMEEKQRAEERPQGEDRVQGDGRLQMESRLLLLVVAVAAVVYLLTFSRSSSYDALSYYKGVEMGGAADLAHPHHLLYLPLQKMWLALWRTLGYEGRAVLPMKALGLPVSLFSIWAFGFALRRFVERRFEFLLLVAAFAFTFLTWHFASEGEPVSFFILFSVLDVALLLYLLSGRHATPRTAMALGAVNGLGILFHQALVLMVPVSLAVLWATAVSTRRPRCILAYALTIGLGVAIPYILVARFLAGVRDVGGFMTWVSAYRHHFEGRGVGQWSNLTIGNIVHGFGRAVLGGGSLKPYVAGGAARDLKFYVSLIPFAWVTLFVVAGLVSFLARLRAILRTHRWCIVTVIVVAVVFTLAATWWQPKQRNFWSPVLPCILMIAGAGLMALPSRRVPLIGRRLLILVLVGVLIWGNLSGGILAKHLGSDEKEPILAELKVRAKASDLVILADTRLWRVVGYFAPEVPAVPITPTGGGFAPGPEEISEAREAAKRALASGNRVFIASEVLRAGEGPADFLDLAPRAAANVRPSFAYIDTYGGIGSHTMFVIESGVDLTR